MILFVRFPDLSLENQGSETKQFSLVWWVVFWLKWIVLKYFAYFLELGQFYGYLTLKCNAIQHEDFRTSHKGCDI